MAEKATLLNDYGFKKSSDHDSFLQQYLPIVSRREQRWEQENVSKGSNYFEDRKFKRFVRKGIPSTRRCDVWMASSGAAQALSLNADPDLFLRQIAKSSNQNNLASIEQIEKDLHRTFPNNKFFDQLHGDSMRYQLELVLRALSNKWPDIGYCQGLNYIAALLLIITQCPEKSFFLMDVSLKHFSSYYTSDMIGLRRDMLVLQKLLEDKEPSIIDHLTELSIDLVLVCSKWFLCWFTESLPTETVLRLWDCFFNEGPKIFFRAAFTLIVKHKCDLLSCRTTMNVTDIFQAMVNDDYVRNCHQFLEDIFTVPGSLPWSKIESLRVEVMNLL